MSNIDQMESALVALLDIEEFSEETIKNMAVLVKGFWDLLADKLDTLSDLRPDAFSTGDGAIVSIGRKCSIDASAGKRFIQFAMDATTELCRKGIIVRTAVNYSEGDRIVFGPRGSLARQYIQIGDTINIASRVVTFCEPREIMLNGSVVNHLFRRFDLQNEFKLHRNDPYVTKHGLNLETYTIIPSPECADTLYSPFEPLHRYKRFHSFPQFKTETVQLFTPTGLDHELHKVVSNVYDAMRYINETKTFLSTHQVLDILTRPHYDPEDVVYVISRNDRHNNFWTQNRSKQYIAFLDGQAAKLGGVINQTRVFVINDDAKDENLPEIRNLEQFQRLHAPGTLFNFPLSLLVHYEYISPLIFGFTVSKKYKYAIIPVPGSDVIEARNLRPECLGELLSRFTNYDAADGPMKAIITAEPQFIESLVADFENLLQSGHAKNLSKKPPYPHLSAAEPGKSKV